MAIRSVLRVVVVLAAVVLAGAGAGRVWAQGQQTAEAPPLKRPAFAHDRVTITHADGSRATFRVEVAQTDAQREYGLMFVRSMPKDAGMLFVFDPPESTGFWMKNTFLPLDILFISPQGIVTRIVAQAKPLDLTLIDSEGLIGSALELNAGQACARHIVLGDRVTRDSTVKASAP